MKVHLYSLCYNEEYILPFFLDYYSTFCEKIVMYDNMSTDSSLDIIRKYKNTEIVSWEVTPEINEQYYLDIKNEAYKASRGIADFVIVCDTDEFVYHTNLIAILEEYKQQGITYPKIEGFSMVPNEMIREGFPQKSLRGVRDVRFDKRAIFSPELDISFHPGCHTSDLPKPRHLVKESYTRDIKLLHYKLISEKYFIQKCRQNRLRLSYENKKNNWGAHYLLDEDILRRHYRNMKQKASQLRF